VTLVFSEMLELYLQYKLGFLRGIKERIPVLKYDKLSPKLNKILMFKTKMSITV
jgi:hypothetical protein